VPGSLAALALLAAACGGGSHSTGTGASTPPNLAQAMNSFMRCMHTHGEPGLYDTRAPASPASGNVLLVFGGFAIQGADPGSPQFQSAQDACRHLLPMGAPPSAAELHKQLINAGRAAACMRAHGYPQWPDPKVIDGRLTNFVPSGIDVNSLRFQAAAKACQASGG
jgi:hypothetical protein